jgi:hypothetical protein
MTYSCFENRTPVCPLPHVSHDIGVHLCSSAIHICFQFYLPAGATGWPESRPTIESPMDLPIR